VTRRRDGAPPRRRLLAPSVAALAGMAVLVGLGIWQMERKAWKDHLIATLEHRLSASAVPLPARSTWPDLTPATDEFRRVSFSGDIIPGQQALVYAFPSALRGDVSGIGYWLFAPVRLPDGGLIVVNRGFVPEAHKHEVASHIPQGRIDFVGIMRWPEQHNLFSPKDDPQHNLWFVRDHRAIAAAKGWDNAAPFFVDIEGPMPAGGLPHPGVMKVNLPNNHFGYALTWFGLAAALAGVFSVWVAREWRERRARAKEEASL